MEAVHLALESVLPSFMNGVCNRTAMILLGPKVRVKNGRPQSVSLRWDFDRISVLLIYRFWCTTPPGARLTIILSYSAYLCILKLAMSRARCMHTWTPHSARSGWASTKRLQGWTFVEVKEAGRWTSDASSRICLDVATVALQEIALPEMERVSDGIAEDFERRFPWW